MAKAVRSLPWVATDSVTADQKTRTVSFVAADTSRVSDAEVVAALAKAGYEGAKRVQ